MIRYSSHLLPNGLRVLLHRDVNTPMLVMNIMYHVGSKNEHPERTGFAHLFEHLMFGGSINIPKYDEPLQRAGGENNAFTNTDITNYYISLPGVNLETACWLESDRMLNLAFSPRSLEVQKQVVVEEFKQNYLNQPYGDVWLNLRPMAFKVHPYQWPTIGKHPDHIEAASMEDVKTFYNRFYSPTNAVLCLSGSFEEEEALAMLDKWFSPIIKERQDPPVLLREPDSTSPERLILDRDVPQDAIYMAFPMCERTHPDYYATDLISDILGNGNSSRLYQELVQGRKLFSEIRAYISGEHDRGLFVVSGRLNPNCDISEAEDQIRLQLQRLIDEEMGPRELQKVKNQAESNTAFSETSLLNKAISLCQGQLLGDPDMVNKETALYDKVSTDDLKRVASALFTEWNANTLIYKPKKKV